MTRVLLQAQFSKAEFPRLPNCIVSKTMEQQGKSYSRGQATAPYRGPLKSQKVTKPSFFNKLKRILDRKTDFIASGLHASQHPGIYTSTSGKTDQRMANIPGGFFSPDNSNTVLHLPKRQRAEPRDFSSASVAESHYSMGSEAADENRSADISNAKLADFFRGKGDQPLSDMEMEGVISLMRKSSTAQSSRRGSIANSINQAKDYTDLGTSRVLKSSRAPSLTSFRAPSFVPKYDISSGSHSTANTGLRSASGRRRVFDYSNMPSPYRTTVYKYSAADNKELSITEASSSAPIVATTKNPAQEDSFSSFGGEHKRLSNTASALVSLLDEAAPDQQQLPSRMANPYSSHVRTYKKVLGGTIKRERVIEHKDKKKTDDLARTQHETTSSEWLPKQVQSSLDKYKPVRSSSLRAGIEIGDHSSKSESNTEDALKELPTSRFTFNFNNVVEKKESNEHKGRADEVKPSFEFSKFENPLSSSHKLFNDLEQQSNSRSSIRNSNNGISKDPNRYSLAAANTQVADDSSPCNSVSTPKISFKKPVISKVNEKFDFGSPFLSNLNTDGIDDDKVKQFRSSFIF